MVKELLKNLPQVQTFPVAEWHPSKVGEIAIYIDEQGRWFYRGSLFCRMKMVKLFSQLLRKEGGDFYLVTPVEKLRIRVEDVPFIVVDVDFLEEEKQKSIQFTTNVGDKVILSSHYPLHMARPKILGLPLEEGGYVPYLRVRHSLEAKVNRNVFYQLVAYSEQCRGRYGVWSEGDFWALD